MYSLPTAVKFINCINILFLNIQLSFHELENVTILLFSPAKEKKNLNFHVNYIDELKSDCSLEKFGL